MRKLFGEGRIDALFESVHKAIESKIERESEEVMLNVDEQSYCNALFQEYYLDKPVLHFENVEADKDRRTVAGRELSYNPRRGSIDTMEVDFFKFYVPYEGEKNLLSMCPYSKILLSGGGAREFYIEDNCVVFEFMDERYDASIVRREFESTVKYVGVMLEALQADIEKFNGELLTRVKGWFSRRKQTLMGANERLQGLGVPVRGQRKTYTIPPPKLRRKIELKIERTSDTHNGRLTPMLAERDYELILSTIDDAGKSLESLPSVYAGKGEEDLRDHILTVLDPTFKLGSATAETFNRSGKTDILLKQGSDVVFVAECKIWKGEKHFSEAISQLLGYLTWRNTRVALIVFVKNQEISSVVTTADAALQRHANYRRAVAGGSASWKRYELHLNGDLGLPIQCSLLLYHMPD